jgi:hypothetical protein
MANYPTPTSYRMAYDADGTQVFSKARTSGGAVAQLTAPQVASINGEVAQTTLAINADTDISAGAAAQLSFVFPQRRDLIGVFVWAMTSNQGGTANCIVDTSQDTTNGIDGTWTAQTSQFVAESVMLPNYRTAIRGVSAPNVVGVRLRFSLALQFSVLPGAVHLYGGFTNPSFDRLAIWHPTLNQELTYQDFQDQTRGTTQTVQFRVRNMSSSLTANSVSVSTSVLTDTTPTVASQITYSSDNSTYSSILNLGNLSPGTTSGVLYMRNSLLSTAAISLWAGRIRASAASFS